MSHHGILVIHACPACASELGIIGSTATRPVPDGFVALVHHHHETDVVERGFQVLPSPDGDPVPDAWCPHLLARTEPGE